MRKSEPAAPLVATRAVKATVKKLPLVQERRDRLIAAAIAVFKEKGFHAATVRDIGRKARMTQGTIYNYVRSKDDVLYLVCDRLVTEYQDATQRALANEADPVLRVHSAARVICEVIHAHQDEILLIYQNTHLLDARSLRVILARVQGFVGVFEQLIRDAAGEVGVEVRNSYLAANIFTFLPTIIALRRWAIGGLPEKESVEEIARFLLRGLGLTGGGRQAPSAAMVDRRRRM